MKQKHRDKFILLIFFLFILTNVGFAELTDFFQNKAPLKNVKIEYVYRFLLDICTRDWSIRGRVYKADSQIQVIFHDDTGQNASTFLNSVNNLNKAFGYEKLVPQISAAENPNSETIIIYYGPLSEGRRRLRAYGARGVSLSTWRFWSFWDDSQNRAISRTFGAISCEQVSELRLSYAIQRICLGALGFPGYSDSYPGLAQPKGGGIFSASRDPVGLENSVENQNKLLTNFDRAAIRFVDRYVKTNSSRGDIVKLVKAKWPDFIHGFCDE